jgi:hypothetical protein
MAQGDNIITTPGTKKRKKLLTTLARRTVVGKIFNDC